MKKLTLLLSFLGSNCELVGKLMLPVAKRRKEDLVSFLNIR